MRDTLALTGAAIFDGATLHHGKTLVIEGARVAAIADAVPEGASVQALPGGTLAPGFVDLQVNGGGGVMFNDAQDAGTLATIARAHAGLGATSILPTLITDTAHVTRAAIAAATRAVRQGVPGIAGLHLEGPHLSLARKGAHDPRFIRPMDEADLAALCEAAAALPTLLVTLAPETVTPDQISRLVAAGVLVSLGHSDASYDTCMAAVKAGARCATHLFNAMSQLGNREPGLVGAALSSGALSAGLIADGVHVHRVAMAAALAAKTGPGRIFLISDAMAVAGTDLDGFGLNDRRIERRDGRLTLADGTLAGADLDLARAVRLLVRDLGTTLPDALAMATSVPADLAGQPALGRIAPGGPANIIHFDDGLGLGSVWQQGAAIPIAAP